MYRSLLPRLCHAARAMPLDKRVLSPGSVIIMSAEDDSAKTIVPRLKAAGADLTKVHLLESVILANGNEALPQLGTDIEKIEKAAATIKDLRLIVIDPVTAYLGGVNDHRNAELRGCSLPSRGLPSTEMSPLSWLRT